MTGASTWIRFVTLCAGLTSLACTTRASSGGDASRPEPAPARLTLTEAIVAAERAIGAGVTVEAEREDDGRRDAFEVEILIDGELREVLVAADDGEILAVRRDPKELAEAEQAAEWLAGAAIGLTQAVALAEQATQATAVEIKVGEHGYVVEVHSDPPLLVTVGFADGATEQSARGEP